MSVLNLIDFKTYVQTPFVKVTIGEYTFGAYGKVQKKVKIEGIQYPNYIQGLTVKKINGSVNTYTLSIKYAMTESSDPNFFEKVFSSVSKSRKIVFSYGDLAMPSFCYKDEEALITKIQRSSSYSASTINYTITAVSSASKLKAGSYQFNGGWFKPSDIIKDLILKNEYYHITDIFTGMKGLTREELSKLIASDDKETFLEDKRNISLYDYIAYLVASMRNISADTDDVSQKGLYSLFVVDEVTDEYNGSYFKVVNSVSTNSDLGIYSIDVNFPNPGNIVIDFSTTDNEAYSILYEYSTEVNKEMYTQRINDDGELEYVYAPVISSKGNESLTTEAERTWWTNVTQFPISATLKLRGLLRTSMLMTHIKINSYIFGRRSIESGTYIITSQEDAISTSGFFTTLSLVRVKADDEV